MIIASIDIGTNTVLLLIADVKPGSDSIQVLQNVYRIPRTGRNLKPGGAMPAPNIAELYSVLQEYKKIIEENNCELILTAATAAFRNASNSADIINNIKNDFNIDIKIISGEEEASLSYLGAVHKYNKGTYNLVIDIGGGSTEVISGTGSNIKNKKSFPVGVVNSSEKYYSNNKFDTKNFLSELKQIFHAPGINDPAPNNAIAVAGTPTTLACIKQNLPVFNEELVEGTRLSLDDLQKIIDVLEKLTPSEILNRFGSVIKGREDLILSGSLILSYLLQLYSLPELIVSTRGIRYGLLYKWIQDQ